MVSSLLEKFGLLNPTTEGYQEQYAFLPNTQLLSEHWGGGYQFKSQPFSQPNIKVFMLLFDFYMDSFDEKKSMRENLESNFKLHTFFEKMLYVGGYTIFDFISLIENNLKAENKHPTLTNIRILIEKLLNQRNQSLKYAYSLSKDQNTYCLNSLETLNTIVQQIQIRKIGDLKALLIDIIEGRKKNNHTGNDAFGQLRHASLSQGSIIDLYLSKDETIYTPLSSMGPYFDQITSIIAYMMPFETYHSSKNKTIIAVKSKLSKSTPILDTLEEKGRITAHLKVPFIELEDDKAFIIIHGETEEVGKLIIQLSSISIDSILAISNDVDFFEKIGELYHDIINVCPTKRGSASIVQMFAFTLIKAKFPDKPLIPFSYTLGINPDILAFILPKDEFAKKFITLFEPQLFDKHYNLKCDRELTLKF
jgi:hypothetical protein